MTHASIKQLRTALATIGASLDEQSLQHGALVVDAPARRTWVATGTHAIRIECVPGYRWRAIADAATLIAMGTRSCTESESDHCDEAAHAS